MMLDLSMLLTNSSQIFNGFLVKPSKSVIEAEMLIRFMGFRTTPVLSSIIDWN